MSIEDRLAKAPLDLRQKGEALRRVLMHGVLDEGGFETTYAAWKQTQAAASAISAEVKTPRAGLAVRDAA
jgi:hypothetical protein